jgi:hypothetical protein
MAGKTTIRADNMLNTAVDVADKAGNARANGYPLLVDTGSQVTLIGYEDAAKGGTWTVGAVGGGQGVGGVGLPFIDLQGG